MESVVLLSLITFQLVALYVHAQYKRLLMIRILWIVNLVGGVTLSSFAITDHAMHNGMFDYWYLHLALGIYMMLLSGSTLFMLRHKKVTI